MDKPTDIPSEDLLAIFAIGPIISMTFNKDATDESHAEAEHNSYGASHFDYEVMVDLVGKDGSCTVGETALENVELRPDINSYGCWNLTHTSKYCCEQWLKWLKSEDRDLATYRRLQKKFAGL